MRSRLLSSVGAATVLTFLIYRSLTASFDTSWQPASGASQQTRSGSQHVVVKYGTTLAQPQQQPVAVEATAATEFPPPPPLADASSSGGRSGGSSTTSSSPAALPSWLEAGKTALAFNEQAQASLAPFNPARTTLHFTFGSAVMMDFVKNWLHFVAKAGLGPILVGAADVPLLQACNKLRVPAAGIIPELDVWTYQRKPKSDELYEIKTEWKYFRHHNSDFLEMGLVKARC